MEKRNTKQAILEESLRLFSEKGYEGTSVKDIANAVGVKDSSLYKHYKSKQEIFKKLLEEMDKRFEETVAFYTLPQGEIEKVAKQYGENDLEWLKKAVEAVFRFFTDDAYAREFLHLLMMEQFRNNQAAELFNDWFIDGALGFQTALFQQMMEEGYFKKADPRTVAVQFYGPIFLIILMYDAKPKQREQTIELLHRHIEAFAEIYHISHGEKNESE